jgi:enoyl-CoA hydratase
MQYRHLLFRKSEGIASITLNRPQVMNALSIDLLKELRTAVQEFGADREVGVLTITGAGKAFSAGADLNSLGVKRLENGRVGEAIDLAANQAINAVADIPKPVIAMVNGHCYTGALELVLACDLALAAESARFGDTHVRWGIRPSWGMSQRLPRRVGWLKAKELSFTARIITAKEAEEIGLINKMVPDDQLEAQVSELARGIMVNSLEAIAAYKRLYNEGMLLTLRDGLRYEAQSEFSIADTQSRIDSFRKKR